MIDELIRLDVDMTVVSGTGCEVVWTGRRRGSCAVVGPMKLKQSPTQSQSLVFTFLDVSGPRERGNPLFFVYH